VDAVCDVGDQNVLKRLLLICCLAVLAIVAFMAVVAALQTYKIRHSYNYFDHKHDEVSDRLMRTCLGRLIVPNNLFDHPVLSEKVLTDERVKAWLTEVLPKTFTFDETDVEQSILEDEHYFTPKGWCHFIDGLLSADKIGITILKKVSTKLRLNGAPILKGSGVESGVYAWHFEVPVILTYRSGTPDFVVRPERRAIVTVTVARSLAGANFHDGLGISEYALTSSSDSQQ